VSSLFPGFPEEGIAFLRSLAKNNNREWFQERKPVFERSVKSPMEQLVDALNTHLVKFAPQYITEPKKAVYRIYRDTRFSKDKTPYKTHIAASLTRAGMEKHISAGFYCSVSPDQIEVAGGIYMPGTDQLRAIRSYLSDNHAELRELLSSRSLHKLMGELYGERMARTPRGFEQDHPAQDLLRYKHWVLYDTRLEPAVATTPKLVSEIAKRFKAMTSFVEFFNRPLSGKRPKDPMFVT
jgi:uncharacterized protein (TIGR02453 family)